MNIATLPRQLRSYFANCASGGESVVSSAIRLPGRLPMLRHGNVNDGFRCYHLPLIAAYPRSGNNWLRYIVEWASERPTPGRRRLAKGYDFVFDRAHNAAPAIERHDAVMLVVRNYRECLLRENGASFDRSGSIDAFLSDEDVRCPCGWYWHNIRAFEAFRGRKMVLYYEDLIRPDAALLNRIWGFLGLSVDAHAFLQDIDAHRERSIGIYDAQHGSFTKGSAQHRHDKSLTRAQKIAFDERLRRELGEQFGPYLGRYPEG